MVDFIFPEICEWLEAKKIIESKQLGKIFNINVEWKFMSYDLKNQIKSWKTNVDEGGGALSFYFSHVFYYLEFFIGRIKNVDCTLFSSKKSLNKGETRVDMTVLFENYCIGRIHLDIGYAGKEIHSLEFHGKKGTMKLKNTSNNFVDNFQLTINKNNNIQSIRLAKHKRSHKNELEDPRINVIKPIAERFINWCKTGVPAKPDFQDGLRVQELIENARSNSNL